MKITFYGARGSIPSPMLLDDYQARVKSILELYKKSNNKDVDNFFSDLPFEYSHTYGGNTSCTTIEEDDKDLIVIDAGSGLRILGKKLIGKNDLTIHIFLSHFHWDHIMGIPFFKPIYNPTNTIIFYSPNENMIENLQRQQNENHFPMPFDKLPAKKKFVILDKTQIYKLNDFSIRNISLNHPGGCSGFIFQKDNKKISYATDTEFTPDNLEESKMFYRACFESSDVLIMDSQYSLSEFFSKFDWGHTSSTMAVNLALEWRIKKLVLFHFDPEHNDQDLIRIIREVKQMQTQYNQRKLEIIQAVEGRFIVV